jgi:CRP/FNR family transcriptional regulator
MFQSHDYCQVLSALIREHWSELNAFTTTEHFERNRVIFSVGDPSDAMFLIESGRVKVSLLSDKGEEKIVAICRKGEVVGEVCLCNRGPRENQAVALETVDVTSFRVDVLLRVLKGKPEIVFNLLMVFCERIHDYQQQLASLAFDDVRGRLAREMLRLSELPDGEPKRGLFELPVRLTHQELADLVSTTRDNVTRIMNEFRKDGLVDYGRERIVIFPDRLEAYLRKRHT